MNINGRSQKYKCYDGCAEIRSYKRLIRKEKNKEDEHGGIANKVQEIDSLEMIKKSFLIMLYVWISHDSTLSMSTPRYLILLHWRN